MRVKIIAKCDNCGEEKEEKDFSTEGSHPIFGSYLSLRASDKHFCEECKKSFEL